ncbi:hypothetical protein V1264_005116 [Littorina saxatilis]|uniref:Chitin-binding type-4 domain-containing protein n=1 Tax=Littorina saxatilis TaxID=31220 RepID=A0AAN9G6L1_9CAEN
MRLAVAAVAVFMAIVNLAEGRARLLEPPMRSSYWREGIQTAPVNFDDELLNCGGFEKQWNENSGACGACGDPPGNLENQHPGKYSQFPPQRAFVSGTNVNATVYSRPNMLGWFEFRLCARKDGPNVTDLQACFDENVLQIKETGMTKFYPGSVGGYSDMHVLLPAGLTCDHCLLQWKYNTGYRTDRNKSTCQSCLGCGPQEQYFNCADIRITPTNVTSPINTTPTPTTTTTTRTTTTTTTTPPPPPSPSITTPAVVSNSTTPASNGTGSLEACTPMSRIAGCEAKGIHRLVPGMEQWCLENCLSGKCRDRFCACFCLYADFKIKIDVAVFNRVTASPSLPMGSPSSTTEKKLCYLPQPAWAQTPGLAGWCQTFCPGKWCAGMCQLSLC